MKSASEKLSSDDDTVRTAGALILGQVYREAPSVEDQSIDDLRRSVLDLRCSFVRERRGRRQATGSVELSMT